MGGPGYCIKGEFAQNGVLNPLKHTPGVLSMARAMSPNSAGSQFFIMHKAAPHLDGAYAAFGKITEGMDVVDKLPKPTRISATGLWKTRRSAPSPWKPSAWIIRNRTKCK